MNNLFVNRNADVAWKLAVPEESAGATAGFHFRSGKTINFTGGDSGMDLSSGLQQNVACHLACLADAVLLLSVADGDVPRFGETHEPR
jgi:hypothetical protein